MMAPKSEPSMTAIASILLAKIKRNAGNGAKIALGIILLTLTKRFLAKKKSVKDKVVLVTGAATGIGQALARKFVEKGANVAVCDINFEMLEDTVQNIRNEVEGAKIEAYKCNLVNKENVFSMVKDIVARQGNVDILVNNAGIVSGGEFLEASDERMELTMHVNCISLFWTVKAVLPSMIERNEGHIATISSAAGYLSTPLMVSYCASKFAARGFMEGLRSELLYLGASGVKTTTVYPTHVNTDLFKGFKAGATISVDFVVRNVIDAIQREVVHVYLPQYILMPIILSHILPVKWMDVLLFSTRKAMKDWNSDKSDQIFDRMKSQ